MMLMSPDCQSPKCHEGMTVKIKDKANQFELDLVKKCAESKVSKKTMWIAGWAILVVICIPLFLTGVRVWSQQEADEYRWATKEEVEVARKDQTEFRVIQNHVQEDLKELKNGQDEQGKDIKEILKYLRKP